MSNDQNFAAPGTRVTAANNVPAEVDVEHAMHQARANTGTIAQASMEVHGQPCTSVRG